MSKQDISNSTGIVDSAKSRAYGLDLLRCVCMYFITIHHMIVYGLGLKSLATGEPPELGAVFYMINAFTVVGVNCFFMLSGYFGIKENYGKALKLYLKCCLYALLITIILGISGMYSGLSSPIGLAKAAIRILLAVRSYWFISVYIAMMFVCPYLDKLLKGLSDKEFRRFVVIVAVLGTVCGYVFNISGLSTGHTFVQGLMMYIIGAYCRRADLPHKLKPAGFGIIYAVMSFMVGLGALVLTKIGKASYSWRIYDYNIPLVVISSAALFCLFAQIKNEGSVIKFFSRLSRYVLAVYLFTDSAHAFSPAEKIVRSHSTALGLVFVLIYACAIFAVCCLTDFILTKLGSLFSKKNKIA